jgi:peptidoglycan/LPS O-acetylase OafA/YrhL
VLPYFRVQPEVATLHTSAPWYWLYGVNILEVVRSNATPFNTGHFWSLSVEEQFYLLWPFVVLGTSRKTLTRAVATLIVVGPLVRAALLYRFGPASGAIAAYTLSIARVDVLGVGAMLALLYRGDEFVWARTRALAPLLGTAALAAFVTSGITRGVAESHRSLMQTIGYSAVALGMGALIADALGTTGHCSPLARIFSGKPLRVLGKYSYCLYVVHYPLMTIVDLLWVHVRIAPVLGSRLPSWFAYGATLFTLSFAIAWVSWRVLEAPMLSLKNRFGFESARPVVPAVGTGMAAAPPSM